MDFHIKCHSSERRRDQEEEREHEVARDRRSRR